MAFVVDRENLRTYDPERGYELFRIGGGSDGTYRFKITGPNGDTTFPANSYREELRPEELEQLGPDYSKTPVVWKVQLWSDDWKPVIREALTAFLINHGSPFPESQAFVRFGEKESVFDV